MSILNRLWRAFSGRHPASCSASDLSNERKAYHVATAASSIVWGGEHGWERDEVGEHDLADALWRYVRDLKKQNDASCLGAKWRLEDKNEKIKILADALREVAKCGCLWGQEAGCNNHCATCIARSTLKAAGLEEA